MRHVRDDLTKHGPLRGIRVVDVSERSVPAALVGMLLADYGAEVVRLEPLGGDPLRALDAARVWLRGQRSAVVGDGGLSEDEAGALCRQADLVLDTAHSGVQKPFRYRPPLPRGQVLAVLTAEPVSVERLTAGEWPIDLAYGELAEARWGFQYIQSGHRDQPIYLGWPHAAYGAAWMLASACLAALYHRETSGRGQIVTTSLMEGLAALNTQRWVGGGSPPLEPWPYISTMDRLGDSTMLIGLFQCRDGRWIQINSGARGATNRLFRAIGREDLVHPDYDVDPGSPFKSHEIAEEFWSMFPSVFRARTVDEWVAILQPLDVSAMPVLLPGQVLATEQALRQGLSVRRGGGIEFGVAGKFSRTPGEPGTSWPAPGDQTAQLGIDTRDTGDVSGPDGAAPPNTGPLAGVTVLDLGLQIAGPYTSRILGDLGARVVKVNGPDAVVGRVLIGSSVGINRGKESVVIDLKCEEGRALLMELVVRADVVHHNLRNGVMERLGIGPDVLEAVNPRLIYCHSSGYGNDGPWASLPAWGPLLEATAGLLSRTGGAGMPPLHYATHIDYGGGLNTVPLILAALVERARSGRGQRLEHPQLGAAMFAMSDVRIDGVAVVETFGLDAGQRGHSAANALYPTADGWVVLACYSQSEWETAHEALGISATESYTSVRSRSFTTGDAAAPIAKALAALRTRDALGRLLAAGVGAAEPRIASGELLLTDELLTLGVVVRYDDPRIGEIFEVGHLARFSATPFRHCRPMAAFGQDTRRVLTELGRDPTDIERLLADHVVADAPINEIAPALGVTGISAGARSSR
jgi:predicted CxxxxCH...CXXCH cytochrome family protein